jgi:hypothetical protein
MTKKRFIKLCMARGMPRNRARYLTTQIGVYESYSSMFFWVDPKRESRKKLERIMTQVLDECCGGLMGLLRNNRLLMNSYFSLF